MSNMNELNKTIADMVQPGKGILAADESAPTIAKRFAAIDVESTQEHRRSYRSLLFTAPGLGEFISGVILFEETLEQQADDGTPLPEVLARQGIVPGIKVDKGKGPLANAPGDQITSALANDCGTTRPWAHASRSGARSTRSVTTTRPHSASRPTPRCWRAMPPPARRRALCLLLNPRS
jgi:fructose-bisphosphate aldolase class I